MTYEIFLLILTIPLFVFNIVQMSFYEEKLWIISQVSDYTIGEGVLSEALLRVLLSLMIIIAWPITLLILIMWGIISLIKLIKKKYYE